MMMAMTMKNKRREEIKEENEKNTKNFAYFF